MAFSEGELYCLEENGVFHSWKILKSDSENNLFVRIYWPEAEKPNSWHSPALSVQRACEEIPAERLKDAENSGFEPVTESDRKEIATYLRIKEGLSQRAVMLSEILENANSHFEAKNWTEAMHLYTEAASFARNNPEIFEKRGKCYENLEMISEATADFNHAKELRPPST